MSEENLVEYIAKNLVNDADAVTIERKDRGRTVVLELHVAQEDMGRVIGKAGRVANAIRSLLRATSERGRKRIILEIE